MRTWLRTLPREYLVFLPVTADSIASEIAMPSEPGWSGSCARNFFPTFVWSLGLVMTSAPYRFMTYFRYGFWSYDTQTMNTFAFKPKKFVTKARADRHCPA